MMNMSSVKAPVPPRSSVKIHWDGVPQRSPPHRRMSHPKFSNMTSFLTTVNQTPYEVSPIFSLAEEEETTETKSLAIVNKVDDYAYIGCDIVIMTDITIVDDESFSGRFKFDITLPITEERWRGLGCALIQNYVDLEELLDDPASFEGMENLNTVYYLKSSMRYIDGISHIVGSSSVDITLDSDFRIACGVKTPNQVVAFLEEANTGIQFDFDDGVKLGGLNSYLTISEFDKIADSITVEADGRKDTAGAGLIVRLQNVRRAASYYELWAFPGEMSFGFQAPSDESGKGDDDEVPDEEVKPDDYPYEGAKCEFYIDGKRQPKDAIVSSTDEASSYGNDVININLSPGQDLLVPGHDVKFVCPQITLVKGVPGNLVATYVGAFVHEQGTAAWYDSVTILRLRNGAATTGIAVATGLAAIASFVAVLF